jgi:putative hemolysin
MLTEIVVIAALILANGLFSMSEMAVISARKSRLKAAADAGDAGARAALALADSPTHFLSTVQIGISVIGTLAAAFGGASVTDELAALLRGYALLAPHSHTIALGLVVLVISYFSLVIGELVPKRIAMANAESIAAAIATPMQKLSTLVLPIVHLLSWSSDAILRLLGRQLQKPPPINDEDIRFLINLSSQTGDLPASERDILERVFQLGDRRAWAVMKPRPEIIWLDVEDSAEQNWHKILASSYSRYPVCRGDLDAIVGIVSLKSLLKVSHAGGDLNLTENLNQPLIVPESKPALEILDLFKNRAIHMAIVVDEFGSIQGLITLGDILEALVGYIVPIDQPAEREAVQREDGSWLFDGTVPIDELKQYLDLRALPEEHAGYYQTLAGFIMNQLGRIPAAGDHFVWAGLRFEVVDMDGRRIDKILVARATPAEPSTPE